MKVFFLIVFTFLYFGSHAQDLHFTQFYESPLNLNPALTGYFPCKYRFGANSKNRFSSMGNLYRTRSGWADTKITVQKIRKMWFGAGLRINHDVEGAGTIKNTSGMATFSFNHGLNKGNRFFYSLGLGIGYNFHSLNTAGLYFNNQWDGNTFNTSLPSMENGINTSSNYFDVSAGFLSTFEAMNGQKFFWGVGLHHINRPVDSFYGSDNKLAMRTMFHLGFDKYFNSIRIKPRVMYEMKQKQSELTFGLNAWVNGGNGTFILGIWSRSGREVAPLVGLAYKGWVFLVNYDLITSTTSTATGMAGGWEFSLVKTFQCSDRIAPTGARNRKIIPRVWDKKSVTCPAFTSL